MRKDIFPSVKEALPVVVLTALFLLLTAVCIGLRTEHLLMTGLFLILFFAGKTTRKLAVALLPFIIFGISYDWMRVYPNYEVNPIDVQGLYEAEKSLFGISIDGTRLIPCEYFAQNHCTVGDFFAGIFYLCWVPVPIAFGLWLSFHLWTERQCICRCSFIACGLYGGGCSIRYYGTLQEMADSFVLCYHGGYLVDGCLFRTSLSD